MKYTIEIIADDYAKEYGDKNTLEFYFRDQLEIVAKTLNLEVQSLNVRVKRGA